MSNGNSPTIISGQFDWWKWLAQQSVMTVFLGFMAYWIGFYIVIPMRDDQKRYIDAVIITNQKNADTFTELRNMHGESTRKLDGIHTAIQQQFPLLQQIRDDQRSGAWTKNGHQ